MGRTTWYGEDGLRRGEWTDDEDRKLVAYVRQHGIHDWSSLPPKAGLQRCGKSCRLRWLNYLKPGIKKGKFSPEEEETIIQLHAVLGNRWATMARKMPNRTDNDIKNHWNSCLKKRLKRSGIDPATHQPIKNPNTTTTTSSSSSSAQLLNRLAASLSSSARPSFGNFSSLDCCMERLRTVGLPVDAANSSGMNDAVMSDQNDAVLTWDEDDAKMMIEELSFLEDVTTSFSGCYGDHFSMCDEETASFPLLP